MRQLINRVTVDKLTEIERLENEFLDVANKVAKMNATEAEQQKTTTEEGSGVKYSYPGPSSLTANRSLMAEAISMKSKGESDDKILQETGWFQGGDGKWRYLISDAAMEFHPKGNFANPDLIRYRELQYKYIADTENMTDNEISEMRSLSKNLQGVKKSPTTLGDYITHNELFAAYPQLKNVNLRFEKMDGNNKGSYSASRNEIVLNQELKQKETELKDTLIHEIQHAIQQIEGFANGGNLELAKKMVFNRAYELVKDSGEFKSLSSEGKVDYILNKIYNELNVENIDEAARKVYSTIYGEIEAREVSKNREKSINELLYTTPNTKGIVYDIAKTNKEYLDVLSEIGYTERQINEKFGSEISDQSRSIQNIWRRVGSAEVGSEVSHNDGRVRDNSFYGHRRSSREKSTDLGRGVRSNVRGAQRQDEVLSYSLPENPTPEQIEQALYDHEISMEA